MASSERRKTRDQEIVGLLPAGGQAVRISPLPCSKELYPIGFRSGEDGQSLRPKVVCHYLLEKMRLAGITQAYIVLRNGKWDIPGYLGDGALVDMNLAYLMMRLPFGAPYTLDQAYPFVKHALVAFGFPDIIFQSEDAFVRLLQRQTTTDAEVVLGLFATHQPQKMDMVDVDGRGTVRSIVIKPRQTRLSYTWIIAVWTSTFTRFMHEYLAAIPMDQAAGQQELFVGDVIQAAIQDGLRVESVLFPDDVCLDIGTPDNLVQAVRGGSGG